MEIEIRRQEPGDEAAVHAAGFLFDHQPRDDATRRFLEDPGHHLLIAYAADGAPVGFISGVEIVHPDKGVEMLLYELGVDEPARRQGVGRRLTDALLALARERGCAEVWVGTEDDNVAARATYESAGGRLNPPIVGYEWRLEG